MPRRGKHITVSGVTYGDEGIERVVSDLLKNSPEFHINTGNERITRRSELLCGFKLNIVYLSTVA